MSVPEFPEENLGAHRKAIVGKTDFGVNTSPQANFNSKTFNDFIADKGNEVLLERGLACPCAIPPTSEAQPSCLNCGGTGYFFIDKTSTIVLSVALSNKTKFIEWTEQNAGTVNLSCKADDMVGFMDKITFTEIETTYSQTRDIISREDDEDNVFIFATYNPITMLEVYAFVSTKEPLFRIKEEWISFEDNKIFISRQALKKKEFKSVTVRYTHHPAYLVFDLPREVIKQKDVALGGDPLDKNYFPSSAIARRVHYMFENPNYGGQKLFDNTDYTTEVKRPRRKRHFEGGVWRERD